MFVRAVLGLYLEQTHVEVELENCEDWNVEIYVHRHTTAPHVLPLLDGVYLLPSDHSEDEEDIGGQRDDLFEQTKDCAVVVAQLVERSLPVPEVRGSNPVMGKFYIEHLFTCLLSTVLKRRK